jgi:hypothetical protein
MSFIRELAARPAELSPLARYTVVNGYVYLAVGAGLYAAPRGVLAALPAVGPLTVTEAGLVHVAGIAVVIIGWFYVMGGRTGATSFGLATVVDRLALPVLAVPILLGGVPAGLVLPLVVLDVVLALGAIAVWRRTA